MSIKTLPSMTHVFTINTKGKSSSLPFEGTFTYKRPNIRIQSEIAKTAAILNGGIPGLDEDIVFLHSVLATLKHTLSNCPEWWTKADFGFELEDTNVILEIYKATRDFENEWTNKVWGNQEEEKKVEG